MSKQKIKEKVMLHPGKASEKKMIDGIVITPLAYLNMPGVVEEIPEKEHEKKNVGDIVITPLTYVNIPGVVEDIPEKKTIEKVSFEMKASKWKIVKESSHQLVPQISRGDMKLANLISELQKFSIEGLDEKSEEISIKEQGNCFKKSQGSLSRFLHQSKFHYSIIVLVIIDLIVVLVDLILAQLSSPCLTDDEMILYNTTEQRESCLLPNSPHLNRGEAFLFYFSIFLLIIFVLEIFLSFYAFGWRHYKNPLYLSDGIIVFSSFVMEIYFHYGNIGRAGRAAAAIVVLRLWKIVRAIHAVAHSITLKNRLLIKKIQEAQIVIEEDKLNTEIMLQKQDIRLQYLTDMLKSCGKCPSPQFIDNYVEKTWKRRQTNS